MQSLFYYFYYFGIILRNRLRKKANGKPGAEAPGCCVIQRICGPLSATRAAPTAIITRAMMA